MQCLLASFPFGQPVLTIIYSRLLLRMLLWQQHALLINLLQHSVLDSGCMSQQHHVCITSWIGGKGLAWRHAEQLQKGTSSANVAEKRNNEKA